MQFTAAYLQLKRGQPFDKELLCFVRETEPHGIVRVQFHQPPKDSHNLLLGLKVWRPVDIVPFLFRIGPHHDLETLNQAVVTSSPLESAADVLFEPTWLRRAPFTSRSSTAFTL